MAKVKRIEHILGAWDSIEVQLNNMKSSLNELPINLLNHFLKHSLTNSQKRILKEIFFEERKSLRANEYFPGLAYPKLKQQIRFCSIKEYLKDFYKDIKHLEEEGLITIAHKFDDIPYYNINKQIIDRSGLMENLRKYIYNCSC